MREALVRVVGEGLADRLPNRGFAVPAASDRRWQEIAEARRTIEPVVLRMSIERGDVDWEARVRAAHHRLARTPAYLPDEGEYYSSSWSEAHRLFHRTLLEGCGNPVLLETFDRMWTASELTRRWSAHRAPTVTASTNTGGWRRRRWPATPTPQPRCWYGTSPGLRRS